MATQLPHETPFGPVTDLPGRPYIRLHRPIEPLEIAEALGDKEMAAAIRERLNKRVHVDINELRAGWRQPPEDTPEQVSDVTIGLGFLVLVAGVLAVTLL